MKFNVKATGFKLTPAISDYVQKKISTLGKYFDENLDYLAQVEVGKASKHNKGEEVFRAEVHLRGAGLNLYAVAEAQGLYAAIDLVEDEMAREILKTKGKRERLLRQGQRAVKNMIKGFPWGFKRFRLRKRL